MAKLNLLTYRTAATTLITTQMKKNIKNETLYNDTQKTNKLFV